MKKKLSLSTLAVISTTLVGCASNTVMPQEPINNNQNQVQISSNTGLNDYMKGLGKMSFSLADKDKDGLLTVTDYLAFDPSNYSLTESEKRLIFKKLDKDADGFISVEDVEKNVKLFLSVFKYVTKETMRAQANTMFSSYDLNKNSEVNLKEFLEFQMKTMSYMFKGSVGLALSGYMFEATDKNKNDSLSFSEFEDFYYNFSKGVLRGYLEGSSTWGQPVDPQPLPLEPEPPTYTTPGYSYPSY